MVEETSRLWFKIRFERSAGRPDRATQETGKASERPQTRKPYVAPFASTGSPAPVS
jgi:hypothetical protein